MAKIPDYDPNWQSKLDSARAVADEGEDWSILLGAAGIVVLLLVVLGLLAWGLIALLG